MRSQGFACSVQHGVGCISLPEANWMKTVFTSRYGNGGGEGGETTGNPDALCGWLFKKRKD